MERSLTDEEINELQVFHMIRFCRHFLFLSLLISIFYLFIYFFKNCCAVECQRAGAEQAECCSKMRVPGAVFNSCNFLHTIFC
jgi:hypothetical protein